jgi:hypothetical protein
MVEFRSINLHQPSHLIGRAVRAQRFSLRCTFALDKGRVAVLAIFRSPELLQFIAVTKDLYEHNKCS